MPSRFEAPVCRRQGAILQDDGVVEWSIWAPTVDRLTLRLWREDAQESYPMTAVGNGYFTFRAPGILAGTRYAYEFPNGNLRPDPASRWQPDSVHQPSAVFFPEHFEWSDDHWKGVPTSELVIYELHIGTFTAEGTFEAAMGRFPELVELGVTAIEIMPVSQFPGNRNWGYDGVHPYAAQNSYGGPGSLQKLVDAAHRAGLAVFLDVVYNHLGPEGNYFSEFGPYFTDHHHTPWGQAVNYDGPDSEPVRLFVVENACQWIRDFHMDGLRLDAVQTIYDFGARHILADIQEAVQQTAARLQRQVQVIAETNQNDRRLLDPPARGGYGMDGVWADDLHHAVHTLLTGESDGYYLDFGSSAHLAKAFQTPFVYDGSYSPFRKRRHGNSAANLAREKFVVSVQTHDQVGNRMLGERFGTLLEPAQQRLAAALLLVTPYTPMMFMGEEYGERNPFPFFCSLTDERFAEAVRQGRREEFAACQFEWTGEPPDPQAAESFESARLSWSWPSGSHAAGMRQLYRDLLDARRKWQALRIHAIPSVSLQGPLCEHGPALLRLEHEHEELTIVANLFASTCELDEEVPAPLLFSSEDHKYGGDRDDDDANNSLLAYELRVHGLGVSL